MKMNWKHKLLALLHDPPAKALDIQGHVEMAQTLLRQAGFSDEETETLSKQSDWAASAADRLPFPSSQASGLKCAFDGVANRFHHPLGGINQGDPLEFHIGTPFATADLASTVAQEIQPVVGQFGDLPDDLGDPCGKRWQARFFAHWRLWQKHAVEKDARFAFLPADTRIPDHTIWSHVQIVSALAGCGDFEDPKAQPKPAFLKLQIGPVQEFIAAARSVRDLWSGSYILSWLMAAGMKALSAEVGPDAVIFPSLKGQPLFDLHWRKDLWSKTSIGGITIWESLGLEDRDMLTPNLPNVLLAIVPADRVRCLGKRIEVAIRNEWRRIAESVWADCQQAGLTADEPGITEAARKARFDQQISRFLTISWQATPWPDSLEGALNLADSFTALGAMPIVTARQRVERVINMATQEMAKDHRDGRYYVGGREGPKTQLNNLGLGWSIVLALNGWELDAVRQTRNFSATAAGGWNVGAFNSKDALTGRDEAVAGGREWMARASRGPWEYLFKREDWISASTLVKRVWHLAYLKAHWGLRTEPDDFRMPNTRGMAAHEPADDCEGDETAEETPSSEKYFAVLALDGDEIGKWISGEKSPIYSSQLADYREGTPPERKGSKVYFENSNFGDFLNARRPLSPGYHIQFSEALSNFALHCARPIVECFDGRLIYAGGDDVLALLPADTALDCAKALRAAFRGSKEVGSLITKAAREMNLRHEEARRQNPRRSHSPYYQKLAAEGQLFECPTEGFLCRCDMPDQSGNPVPFLVPGPAADCSVGIAIAHFKAPLQDVVRAAQAAEKRAKGGLGRSAVAVTLFKRSGECIEWGCKWASGGLELYADIAQALNSGAVSSKFPHRVVELLEPYIAQKTGLQWDAIKKLEPEAAESAARELDVQAFEKQVDKIIQREFSIVCSRQQGPNRSPELTQKLQTSLADYLSDLKEQESTKTKLPKVAVSTPMLQGVIGLCQTVAFANRTAAETTTQS